MQDPNKEITDVEFKEVQADPKSPEGFFNPVKYLTDALTAAGYHDPEGWTKNIDLRAANAVEEKERIFFANRALRLYLSEIPERDNVTPRMMVSDGIDSVKWAALMDQGIVPWLMNQFDKKGKRIQPEAAVSTQPAEEWDPSGEMDTGRLVDTPVLKVFEGDLGLTDDEKAQVRAFLESDVTEVVISDRRYMKIHRDGATCREWSFVSEPNVFYLLRHSDYS